MLHVDSKYIPLISPQLKKFSKKNNKLYNFRCPYCGDSQKNQNRARGYFFVKKTSYVFKCHNCGAGRSLANFLKDHDTSLYDQYLLESYKEGVSGKGTPTPLPEFKFDKPVFKKNILSDLTRISDLNKTHPARVFVERRKLPNHSIEDLYFCPKFKEWTNKHKPIFKNVQYDESRIIIPLKDETGVFGYQGRSLYPNASIRYITVMLNDEKQKIYGLDKVDKTKTIYVTEGPFDSLFISNAIAMCGSDVNISNDHDQYVFVFDNEPRNREIVAKIDKYIEQGSRVVIWDSGIKEKDINDMVLAGRDVQSMIESSVYHGLEAKLKFTQWKQV